MLAFWAYGLLRWPHDYQPCLREHHALCLVCKLHIHHPVIAWIDNPYMLHQTQIQSEMLGAWQEIATATQVCSPWGPCMYAAEASLQHTQPHQDQSPGQALPNRSTDLIDWTAPGTGSSSRGRLSFRPQQPVGGSGQAHTWLGCSRKSAITRWADWGPPVGTACPNSGLGIMGSVPYQGTWATGAPGVPNLGQYTGRAIPRAWPGMP